VQLLHHEMMGSVTFVTVRPKYVAHVTAQGLPVNFFAEPQYSSIYLDLFGGFLALVAVSELRSYLTEGLGKRPRV